MENTNITEIISATINSIFSNLFSSIDNTLYSALDDITFISSSILDDSYFEKILGTNSSNGIILICNSLIIGIILYYAVSYMLAHLSLNKTISPIKFIFRLVILAILINFSSFICGLFLDINSYISLAIRNIGEDIFDKSICFSSLIKEMNSLVTIDADTFNLFSLDGLIKSFISIGFFNLAFSYSLRYILIKLFVLLAPFALLSLAFEKTAWFFQTWLRGFLSLLFVQIIVSLLLVLTFSLDFEDSKLISKLLLIGSIYALTKANSYIRELIGGVSTEFNLNIRNMLRR